MELCNKFKIFRMISETIDKDSALAYENIFFSKLVSITMMVGALSSFTVFYYLLELGMKRAFLTGGTMALVGFFSMLVSKVKNEILKMYIFAMIISVFLWISYFSYYDVIGPGVFSISFLLMLTILIYSRIQVLLIFLISNMMMNTYAWIDNINTQEWPGFYPANTIVVATISFVAIYLFKVFKSRQNKIIELYSTISSSQEKLYSTLISVGEGVISVDDEGFIEHINPVATLLTGWSEEEAIGQRFEKVFKIINGSTRSLSLSLIQQVLEKGEKVEIEELTFLVGIDTGERPISAIASPILGKSGEYIGTVVVFKDISENIYKQNEAERISHIDHLTQVYNRRFLEQELIRVDKRPFFPISIIFVDINGLKIINDAFGHEYGDQLIVEVANGLKSGCRSKDIISRIGGDEFVILLPNTTTSDSSEVITRIKSYLDQKKIHELKINFSFGIATKEKPEEDIMDVLKNAEDYMYEDKMADVNQRRNVVIQSIIESLFERSPYERIHSEQVSELCVRFGRAFQLDDKRIDELRVLGALHDIGKISIKKEVLNGQHELSSQDWKDFTNHPEIGYRILSTTRTYFHIAEQVLAHHERWDGTGYPKKLKGTEINWESRVLAIAESYIYMINEHINKKAMTHEEAIVELENNAGTQFDPELVAFFINKVI